MKTALVLLNVLLGLLLAWTAVDLVRSPASKTSAYSVKKREAAKKGIPSKKAENPSSKASARQPMFRNDEERIRAIVDADLFNSERSPNASMRGRAGRVEMTLVGICRIGGVEGAVIRQNTFRRQFNPFLVPPGGAPGNFGGGAGPGAGFNRFSGGLQRFGAGMNLQRNSNVPTRQYVRVGETLSNGYKLIEVTRSGAVLVRGGDRIELELQPPSRNRVAGNSAPRRLDAAQQFQQAQMITQMRMLQMMQQMQRNMNGGGGAGGAPAPRGGGAGGRGRNR